MHYNKAGRRCTGELALGEWRNSLLKLLVDVMKTIQASNIHK